MLIQLLLLIANAIQAMAPAHISINTSIKRVTVLEGFGIDSPDLMESFLLTYLDEDATKYINHPSS